MWRILVAEKINVLVTGVGGGVGQSIVKAIKLSQLDCNIVVTDAHPLAAGIYRGNKGYLVPLARSPRFLEVIIDICKKEKIHAILIGLDPELPVFASHREVVEDLTGAKVVVSSPEVVKIGYDKWETYTFLKNNAFPYPRSTLPEDRGNFVDEVGFPIIIKPRTGSASRDVYLARNSEELEVFIKRVENSIIQEYLGSETEEYTSGVVMFDEILGAITIKRELKRGVTFRALVDNYETVKAASVSIASALCPFGPCNFQMRVVQGAPVTFEINTRFSGTTAIRAAFGFNEVETVLKYILFGQRLTLAYRTGVAMRYWNEVYSNFEEYQSLQAKQSIESSNSEIIPYF